jgi:hypothetical protein
MVHVKPPETERRNGIDSELSTTALALLLRPQVSANNSIRDRIPAR